MAQTKYQTRLPADTAEQVNDYIEDREISQSEAIRRLVETGLEVEPRGLTPTREIDETAFEVAFDGPFA